eukprot:31900_1
MASTNFILVNINEFTFNNDTERNQLKGLLIQNDNIDLGVLPVQATCNHPARERRRIMVRCYVCQQSLCGECQIKMCYTCGESICQSHAVITDPSHPFTSTFCTRCRPPSNEEDEKDEQQSGLYKLHYTLPRDRRNYTTTGMVNILHHFIQQQQPSNV